MVHYVLAGARQVFFIAMLDGYAGGANQKSTKTKTPDGYTTIEFLDESGDFKVVDRYCTTPLSNYSAGTTTIYYMGNPVWWMSYGGHYPEAVVPFLKSMLKQAYGIGKFYGGRGNTDFPEENGLVYRNFPGVGSDFTRFRGCEQICSKETDELLGFHEYFGMRLL